MFGKHKESGFWIAPSSQWRIMFFGHDALYVAACRIRVRLMKSEAVHGSKEQKNDTARSI